MRHRLDNAKRAAYYRQQASACATAALATVIAEVRQAYLDLEQGWLCLAPKAEESSVVSALVKNADDADTRPSRLSSGNTPHGLTG